MSQEIRFHEGKLDRATVDPQLEGAISAASDAEREGMAIRQSAGDGVVRGGLGPEHRHQPALAVPLGEERQPDRGRVRGPLAVEKTRSPRLVPGCRHQEDGESIAAPAQGRRGAGNRR